MGGRKDPVNEQGLLFYDHVINECIRQGVTPFVVSQYLLVQFPG
jgi:beta-glucosidase/6-phospho-beta-glucosidase/beta-galactosidase